MVKQVIGQLDLFNVENYSDHGASNFGCELSLVSTRSKVPVRPQIKRETLDRVSAKLTLLPPLNSPQLNHSKD